MVENEDAAVVIGCDGDGSKFGVEFEFEFEFEFCPLGDDVMFVMRVMLLVACNC